MNGVGWLGRHAQKIGLGTWKYAGGEQPTTTGIGLGATPVDIVEAYGTEEAVSEAVRRILDKLNWCISKDNMIAIPKSDSAERTKENCGASGGSMTPKQIKRLETAKERL